IPRFLEQPAVAPHRRQRRQPAAAGAGPLRVPEPLRDLVPLPAGGLDGGRAARDPALCPAAEAVYPGNRFDRVERVTDMEVRAGVARVTITPPIGINLIGFAGRGPSDGLHDDLTATALVLEGPDARRADGAPGAETMRLAIIACDLLFLRADEVHAVREAVGRLTDVRGDNVVVCCSHTH